MLACGLFISQIAGVEAARTLLADLLTCTDAARGVGELALYWAARAKLEEVGWQWEWLGAVRSNSDLLITCLFFYHSNIITIEIAAGLITGWGGQTSGWDYKCLNIYYVFR